MKRKITFFALFFLIITSGFAQVTTSKIKGVVKDASGSLMGAEVMITHIPTGTMTGTVTQETGRFYMPNLRIGGPYTIVVKYVGYKTEP
jgi:hypothetical protein